jgi:hypothetical protein
MQCCYDALKLSSPLSRGLRVAWNTHEVARLTCMRSEDLTVAEELWLSMHGHRKISESCTMMEQILPQVLCMHLAPDE